MHGFYDIERLDQLRALQSPLRVQLVAVLRDLGDASVRQLAEQMDTRPEGLQYHVRELLAVGLLERVGKRKVRRRMETVYRLPGSDLRVAVDGRGEQYLSLVAGVYGAALRFADRTMARALGCRAGTEPSTAVAPRLIQVSARLRMRPRKEVSRRIRELEEFIREHHDPSAPDVYLLTVACSEKAGKQPGREQ